MNIDNDRYLVTIMEYLNQPRARKRAGMQLITSNRQLTCVSDIHFNIFQRQNYCSYSRTTWEINILFISKSCNPSKNLKNIIKRFYTYFLFCLIKISFFRIWIIPPPKKRNPVSSATSTYHMMEKEIHWCSDLWGHRHGVRIYCQNFFFIWMGLFHCCCSTQW